MPILWRYLTSRYLKIFSLSILGFTSFLFLSHLEEIAYLASFNSQTSVVLLFTACQIPHILNLAIPISALVASLSLIRRLSRNHELTSFRSSGISIQALSFPLLMVSLALSFANFVILFEITPLTRLYSQKLFLDAVTLNPLSLCKGNGLLEKEDYYIHAQVSVKEGRAHNLLLALKNRSNGRLILLTADQFQKEGAQLIGKNVGVISYLDPEKSHAFNHLIIENQKSTSTPISCLSQIIQKTPLHFGSHHLLTRDLLRAAFEKSDHLEEVRKARFELMRRLFLTLITYLFTFMGISLGLRNRKKGGQSTLLLASLITAFTFICGVAAKTFRLHPLQAALCYSAPFPLILLISFWFQRRAARGIE